eukprot:4775560-Heterocapsa_arctica.AAC.1
MGASEAFSSISIPEGSWLFTASADIEACFYQCGECISVGLTSDCNGMPITSACACIYPALAV